jgi:hypothetical protein
LQELKLFEDTLVVQEELCRVENVFRRCWASLEIEAWHLQCCSRKEGMVNYRKKQDKIAGECTLDVY